MVINPQMKLQFDLIVIYNLYLIDPFSKQISIQQDEWHEQEVKPKGRTVLTIDYQIFAQQNINGLILNQRANQYFFYQIKILFDQIDIILMQDTGTTVLIFLINGINSLLGWNVVLAAFDYFQNSFKDYNIYTYLSIPLFIGYIVVGSTYHIISKKFKYVNLIMAGNIGINVSLGAILIVSIALKQTLGGFILLLMCAFLLGVFSNVSQLTFFAMINYLSQEVVSKFTVGTAISGLFITFIRIIITASFGVGNDSVVPIIIYFLIGMAFNTLDLLMNIRFCKSDVYKQKIEKFLVSQDSQETSLKSIKDDITSKSSSNSQTNTSPLVESQQRRIQKQNYFTTLIQTSKHIFPYPWIIMFTFVITFTLFPGPSLDKTFDDLEVSWSVLIMITSYNIGDTVGKYTAGINGAFNRYSLFFIFFARLLFFVPITVMATGNDKQDALLNNYFFPFFNQFLFAVTNGFCINASFIMAFKVCPNLYKKYAGVFCGLILQVGIITGTIVQVPYSFIFGIN